MRCYETEYQFPLRHLNTGLWPHICEVGGGGAGGMGQGAGDDNRHGGGGAAPSSPAHPTFMPTQGALLTTNKSTARSNLSQKRVGRESGVWGDGGWKGKEKKKVEMKGGGGSGGKRDRKSDKERG